MSLGATLRQARGARKLSAEQISSATRIPHWIIVAMEQDDWSRVPGGIFARGYLRAYAREVGLDGAELAAQFDAEHAPAPDVPQDAPAATTGAPRTVVRLRLPVLPDGASRWMTGSAMVALLLFVYVAGRWSTTDQQPVAQPPASVEAARPANALGATVAQPVGTSAPLAAAAAREVKDASGGRVVAGDRELPTPVANTPLVVDVAVTRPCWVAASADGARFLYRVLNPGERIQARGRALTFRVGDAGALQLSLDGQPARPLGASGEVVSVQITRENYRSLLPPPKAGN